jgi:hypothetical protein
MNTEVKHTPWVIENITKTIVKDSQGRIIYDAADYELEYDEAKAHARLFNAAPELLEALKIAQQYMNVFLIRGEEPLVGDSLKTDHYKVLEAIKKATV